MFCINIEQLNQKVSLSKIQFYIGFSPLALYLILSRGNNFLIFFKIKQKISQIKQFFHNLNSKKEL